MTRQSISLLALSWLPAQVAAHPIDTAVPSPTLPSWSFEPWVLCCLLLSAGLYAIGICRLWQRAGNGRGAAPRHVAAFALGWLSLVIALVSPLDGLGGQLFTAHMVQHELLMVISAPLLCLGRPLGVWVWALPMSARQVLGRWTRHRTWQAFWGRLAGPPSAWTLHALALWSWHVPVLFDAALADSAVHTAQHLSFLGSALLFWWSALQASTRPSQGHALFYLFTTMIHTSALGALLTLSPVVWYVPYQASAAAWGLDALEDQQLGGLVMWVPAGFAYLAAGLALATRWIGLFRPA